MFNNYSEFILKKQTNLKNLTLLEKLNLPNIEALTPFEKQLYPKYLRAIAMAGEIFTSK